MEWIVGPLAVADLALLSGASLTLVVLGILINIRFLGYLDLTCDGSFTAGAGVYAMFSLKGFGTLSSIGFAICAGLVAGLLYSNDS